MTFENSILVVIIILNYAPYHYSEKSLTQFETIVLDSHDTLEDVLTGLLEDDDEMNDNDEFGNIDQEVGNNNDDMADQIDGDDDDNENADTTNLAEK